MDPRSPALRRIAALAGLRRWADVEREARRLLLAEPDTWPGHTWLSRALREQGRAEEALAAAERAVACAPEEGPPYELLGRALFVLGRGAEGLRAARDAVSRGSSPFAWCKGVKSSQRSRN